MSKSASRVNNQTGILAHRYALQAQRYFDRHGYAAQPGLPAPDPALGLVVVVPALAEPDVVATLDSVARAARPDCAAELLLVVNAATDAGADVQRANEASIAAAREWAAHKQDGWLSCHVLDHRDLPAGHATVGLARKIGLDAGLARLAATSAGRGVLVSLDADCRVAPDYLASISHYFRQCPDSVGATIYFEHPLDEAGAGLRQAIVDYELHLRCYRHGLAAAGSPYATYTVGSAFAVRSEIYAQEGGMNRRAAGEDFYFINKLCRRGVMGEISDTTVFPAARLSDRVPFGTGAAMRRAAHEPVTTYDAAVYRQLRRLLKALTGHVFALQPLPREYAAFFETMRFGEWLDKTRANVASDDALSDQLRRWMDGFRIMKFVNWLTRERYRRVATATAASDILRWKSIRPASDARGLLEQFRTLDRA